MSEDRDPHKAVDYILLNGKNFARAKSERIYLKRQIVQRQLSAEENIARNGVLEEIAIVFDKMRSSGDTAASFAAYVRGMKT